MKQPKRVGNWTPDGKAELAALRLDYTQLTGAERMEQVFELSRIITQLAEAGRRERGA